MQLKIKKTNPSAILPSYAYEDDAAFDLFSIVDITINPGEFKQIPTGIAMQIPTGHVGLIWDKSSIAQKHGLKNLGGVVDSGYRGEVQVGLANVGNDSYSISKGQKVGQVIIQKKETCEILEVDSLDDSDRGEGGFGSSGK